MANQSVIQYLGKHFRESDKVLTLDDNIDFDSLGYGDMTQADTLDRLLTDLNVFDILESLYIELEFLYCMPKVLQKFENLGVLVLNSGKLMEYDISWVPRSVRSLTLACNASVSHLAMMQLHNLPQGIQKLRLPFPPNLSENAVVLPALPFLEQLYIPYRLRNNQAHCWVFMRNYTWTTSDDPTFVRVNLLNDKIVAY